MILEFCFLIVLGLIGLWLFSGFVTQFVRPSRRLRRALNQLADLIEAQNDQRAGGAHVVDFGPLESAFAPGTPVEHLRQPWIEFRHTLHGEREALGEPATRWRQTVPAETYFHNGVVVDAPLNAEYFRHLPGIFTGLGIIGTFSGLLIGLWGFHPGTDVGGVNDSVDSLLSSVRDAFFVSAAAIATAMGVTWYEKRQLSKLYRASEGLREALDKLFDAGAGEDYLAAIRRSSAESVSGLDRMRTAIQEDLIDAIAQVSEVQREVGKQTSREIGEQIAGGLTPAV